MQKLILLVVMGLLCVSCQSPLTPDSLVWNILNVKETVYITYDENCNVSEKVIIDTLRYSDPPNKIVTYHDTITVNNFQCR